MEQETLIYIEENDKKEARILTQSFANKETKSRAYINALGAELGMKYLTLENIINCKTYNLHSIHKILEELDISDIMLSNIHIDVRVVFDENLIFIPKSHFEYDILPDIYLVLNISEDHAHAKFLGFFEPQLINKNNQNEKYYFIEKEKLSSPMNLKEYVENFKGSTTLTLSDEETENAEILMVSLIDQNVSKDEMKELLKYLTKSAELRDKFVEFENFETLSYKSLHTPGIEIPKDTEEEVPIDETIDGIGNFDTSDLLSSTEQNGENPENNTQEETENGLSDDSDIFTDIETTNEDYTDTTLLENENLSIDINEMNEVDNFEDFDLDNNIENESTTSKSETNPEEFSDNKKSDSNLMSTLTDTAITASAATAGMAIAGEAAVAAETFDLAGTIGENIIESTESFIKGSFESESDNNITSANSNTISGFEQNLTELEDLSNMDAVLPMETSENIELEDVETQDLNSIQTVEIAQDNFEQAEIELESLDISNVNVIPNNFDTNFSETIEFNNIEKAENEPCSNEINGENTAPTVNLDNIDSFNGLDPINPENMIFPDNSVDIDNLNISNINDSIQTIDKESSNKFSTIEEFEPFDFENITLDMGISQNNSINTQNHNESYTDTINQDELNSSLDEIPDFNSDLDIGMEGLDSIPDINDSNTPLTDNDINTNEISDIPDFNDLENLTTDDIVETTVDEIPSFNDSEIENSESINNISNLDSSDSSDINEISDFVDSSDSSDSSDINETSDFVDSSDSSDSSDINEISDFVDSSNSYNSSEEKEKEFEIPDENPEFTAIAGLDDLTAEDSKEDIRTEDSENFQEEQEIAEDEETDINMLFEEEPGSMADSEQIQSLDSPFLNRQVSKTPNNMKKVLIGVITAVLLGGSFFAFILKNKTSNAELESLAQNGVGTEIPAEESSSTSVPETPIATAPDNSDILANTPAVETIPPAQTENKTKEIKPAANSATKGTKPINPTGTYLNVKKLLWEVPDYLSYSSNIKKYLQTAGKSIKLTLSSDLLLTNEYAYSNQVKVSMKLSNDGTLKDIQIIQSSGSDQINKIVLQTVKDTLNVIKPATGEVPTPEFRLGLIINF